MEIDALLKYLSGNTVGIDTMCFIYAFEENPTYLHIVKPLFEQIEKGEIKGITSTITVAESLVRPFERGDVSLLSRYRIVFRDFPNLAVVLPTIEISEKAAELRAIHKIRMPDALQISTSLIHNAKMFITNDLPLSKVSNIEIVQLDDLIH